MSIESEITWFLEKFSDRMAAEIEGTPISLELLAAIAYQETGYTWSRIRRVASDETEFLLYCVGDVIDDESRYPRRAFPKNKTALIRHDQGREMYEIARESVERIASVVGDYRYAANDPGKFCRGYGIFQYDLQFFKTDPDYFLSESWKDFGLCFGKAIGELVPKAARLGFSGGTKLSARNAASVAIAYNTGGYKPERGLRQGYKVGDRYYGELVYDYIRIAKRLLSQQAGSSLDGPVDAGGLFVVNARPWLNVRSMPNGEKSGKLLPGTQISVLRQHSLSPDWVLIDIEGDGVADGYVMSDYLIEV